MPSENNKRIAKNTIMLYIRMMGTMGISFYTTRIVLAALGVVDYGLVNVIGSAVSMFSFLSISLSTAASRYFNFYLGTDNFHELRRTFSMIIMLYGVLFVVLLFLSESIGLWIFRTKLVIPEARIEAATWFFHTSVGTLLIGLWSVPYQSIVISHENMRLYSFASIFEAAAKLGIIFFLTFAEYDKLKLYGVLLLLVTILHLLLYKTFCWIKYPETRFVAYFNMHKFKNLVSFSGWNLFGSVSYILNNVIINILLNNFFGAVVNAARGIASQVSNGAQVFTQNFLMASRPQIVKFWAQKEQQQFHLLVCRASKIGYALMLIVSLPAFLEMDYLLAFWLKHVPDHAVNLTRIVIVARLVECISYPVGTAIQATGFVAVYQTLMGTVIFVSLFMVWIVLKLGGSPEQAIFVSIFMSFALTTVRLVFYKILTKVRLRMYSMTVIIPSLLITVIAGLVPGVFLVTIPVSLMRFLLVGFSSVFGIVAASFLLLLTSSERHRCISAGILFLKRRYARNS